MAADSSSAVGWLAATFVVLIVLVVAAWAWTVRSRLAKPMSWTAVEGSKTPAQWSCPGGGTVSVQGATYTCGGSAGSDVSASAARLLNGSPGMTVDASATPFYALLGVANTCGAAGATFSGAYVCV